jgi:hypothetical protein
LATDHSAGTLSQIERKPNAALIANRVSIPMDGGEHDGIVIAETDDEAANATFQKSSPKPLPGRRIQISAVMADPVRAVYVRILTAANKCALTAWWRLDCVLTGPDLRIEKTQNSLCLAIDGDQRMDEKSIRDAIATRTKAAMIGRPAKLISVVSCATTMRRPAVAATVRLAKVCSISVPVTDRADRNRGIAISPERVAPSLRMTNEPVAVTRSNSSVPTAARHASPK